jgi:hypothetical protein
MRTIKTEPPYNSSGSPSIFLSSTLERVVEEATVRGVKFVSTQMAHFTFHTLPTKFSQQMGSPLHSSREKSFLTNTKMINIGSECDAHDVVTIYRLSKIISGRSQKSSLGTEDFFPILPGFSKGEITKSGDSEKISISRKWRGNAHKTSEIAGHTLRPRQIRLCNQAFAIKCDKRTIKHSISKSRLSII